MFWPSVLVLWRPFYKLPSVTWLFHSLFKYVTFYFIECKKSTLHSFLDFRHFIKHFELFSVTPLLCLFFFILKYFNVCSFFPPTGMYFQIRDFVLHCPQCKNLHSKTSAVSTGHFNIYLLHMYRCLIFCMLDFTTFLSVSLVVFLSPFSFCSEAVFVSSSVSRCFCLSGVRW